MGKREEQIVLCHTQWHAAKAAEPTACEPRCGMAAECGAVLL